MADRQMTQPSNLLNGLYVPSTVPLTCPLFYKDEQ